MTTSKPQPCNYADLLGVVFGLSTQDILAKWGMIDRRKPFYVCLQCNKPYSRHKEWQSKRFCSSQCRLDYFYPQVVCDWCGCLFRRRATVLAAKRTRIPKQRFIVCSRQCQGGWIAQQRYGGGRTLPFGKGKWDSLSLQISVDRAAGLSYSQLARKYKISASCIFYILGRYARLSESSIQLSTSPSTNALFTYTPR